MAFVQRQLLLLALAGYVLHPASVRAQKPIVTNNLADSNLPAPEWVRLSNQEQGITEPVLIQLASPSNSECSGSKRDGSVKFSFVIDSEGDPRNVVFEHAMSNEIDLLALKAVLDSRFRPAIINGAPVAVGREVEMHLKVCIESSATQSGNPKEALRLRFAPEVKFEQWSHPPTQVNLAPITIFPGAQADHMTINITPPKTLTHPDPPDSGGRSGEFSFRVLIDEHGIPQDLELLKSTDEALLPKVSQCIRNIRYIPARKDGMPVPALLTVGLSISSGR